jgi:hypothetical protein
MVGFFIALQIQGSIVYAQAEAIKPFLFDPSPSVVSLDNYSSVGQESADGKPTVQEVKDYLRVIYGNRWKLAWAVAEAECNHTRKEWPMCSFSWAKELSIGILQINIAKDEGRGAWVHWEKIPGNNLQEKQAWLMDWKHNILMAFVISKGGTDFGPWTGFTSNNYKKFL